MEKLLKFTGIVMIAFGILQIILFFKIWAMTNDIRLFRNKYIGNSDDWTFRKAVLEGDKSLISKILFSNMFIEIKELYNDSVPDTEGARIKAFEKKIAAIKSTYKDKYLKYEIDFPKDIDKIEKPEDIEKL